MKHTIGLVRPKLFIAENVKGLTTLGDAQAIITQDFADAGYYVFPPRVLNAADYGIPQRRERVFFIGLRLDALTDETRHILTATPGYVPDDYSPYPHPTHGTDRPYVTTKQALIGLDEPDSTSDPDQQAYSKVKYFKPGYQGQTEINLNGLAPTILSEHHGKIEFRRLSLEHGGTHHSELAKGYPERRLTIRECARLQTFPDDYRFVQPKHGNLPAVSTTSAYKLIGNAVPPLLAYHFAQRIQHQWKRYFGAPSPDTQAGLS